jgi:transposase
MTVLDALPACCQRSFLGGTVKRFITFDPDQPLLLPVDLRTALPAGHAALLLADIAEQLDLSEVLAGLEDEALGGRPGFDPRMMVRVWLYAYLVGIRSSRKLALALVENIAFRMLANNQTPQYWALNRFRSRHRGALGNLLVQTVSLASELGLVKLGVVAIDGTKIRANASKHKALSYGRMMEREAALRAEVEAFLRQSESVDAEEDRTLGPDDEGSSLPLELQDVQARRRKIAEAKRELERRARAKVASDQAKRRERAHEQGKGYEPRRDAEEALPGAADQINLTDPESRIMTSGGAFVQAFNAQAAVDAETHIVLAAMVTNQAADAPHFEPITKQVIANVGATPELLVADAGYHSEANLACADALEIDALIPAGKVKHSAWRQRRAPRGRIPNAITPKELMQRRLATQRGKRAYARRQGSVEPVFGSTKQHRGLRQFLHRGVEANHHLFRFDMAVHNLMKIIKHLQRLTLPQGAPQRPTERLARVTNAAQAVI